MEIEKKNSNYMSLHGKSHLVIEMNVIYNTSL